jgi:signal transduction histidine kinase
MQPRIVDVNEVVQNLLKMLRRLLGEHIAIKFDSQGQLPTVEADVGMIEQVLLNLAVNARDAMPKGGNLTIATSVLELDDEAVKLNSERRAGKFVCFSVTDTGTGMDEGMLKRIFEPFFTTKEVGKGTGLGLSMVYGFARQSGGHIALRSQPGRGTQAILHLPAIRDLS